MEFEWKPIKCGFCEMLGHNEDECKRKLPRMEWRPKIQNKEAHRDEGPTTVAQQTAPEEEGFTSVTRKANTRVIPQQVPQPLQQNSFQILMNEETEESSGAVNPPHDKSGQLEHKGPELA